MQLYSYAGALRLCTGGVGDVGGVIWWLGVCMWHGASTHSSVLHVQDQAARKLDTGLPPQTEEWCAVSRSRWKPQAGN